MTLARASLHQNNFDLLRFTFAFMVFLVHAHVLSQRPELAALSRWLSAELAVESFFVVSGYLVFMSFENSASTADYLEKRARRIYPAYFAVVVAAAAAGIALTQLPLGAYLSSGTVRYLVANLAFLNFLAPELPGVFQSNPVTAVNGALWTLKIEVMFYLCVPVIAALGARLGRGGVLAAIYVASVCYAIMFELLARETGRELYLQLGRQLPGQLAYFVAGAWGYYFLERVRGRWAILAPAASLALLLPLPRPVALALDPAALGILVIYLAMGFQWLGNFGRHGDLSYGIYIIHFPILQTLVSLGAFDAAPYGALALAAALVLGGAYASWHLIEKPFLRRTSHYVVAERATDPT